MLMTNELVKLNNEKLHIQVVMKRIVIRNYLGISNT